MPREAVAGRAPAAERLAAAATRDHAVLVAVALLGAALRFFRLGSQSFWYDEAVSAALARSRAWDLFTGRVRDLGNPPLHPLLLHAWSRFVGGGDGALRALSAVAGTLAIPVLYALGRRLLGSRAALLAAGLLAASPLHVYLAQETRTYALVTLLALLSVETLLRALERPGSAGRWALYAVATFAAAYAHYFALLVALAESAFVLARHRDRRVLGRLALSLGAAALLYATWVPALVAQATTHGNLGRSPESWWLHALATPLVFSVGTTLAWKGLPGAVALVLAAAAALVATALAAAGLWARRRDPPVLVPALWLGITVGLPLAVSAAVPFYNVRYVALAAPAFYLLVAAGLEIAPRPGRAFAIALLALAAVASLGRYFTTEVKHDWRGAARFVEARAQRGDLLLFDADFNETSYGRYGGADRPRLRLLAANGAGSDHLFGVARPGERIRDVTDAVVSRSRVWLVLSDADASRGERDLAVLRRTFDCSDRASFTAIEVWLCRRGAAMTTATPTPTASPTPTISPGHPIPNGRSR